MGVFEAGSSRVLTGPEILTELRSARLIAPGTWAESCARAAKYDLRMGTRLLIIEDPIEGQDVVFPDETLLRPIAIHPGGVALVATAERLRIPFNVAATIGAKFHLARQGVLLLNGLHVDPGYGMTNVSVDEAERTVADHNLFHDGEPLLFMLANVGARHVHLKPGEDVIATIQFTVLSQPAPPFPSTATHFIHKTFDLGRSPAASRQVTHVGLDFFRRAEGLRAEVDDLRKTVGEVEHGTKHVVNFGIFLIAASLFSLFLTTMINYAKDPVVLERLMRLLRYFATHPWASLVVIGVAIIGSLTLQIGLRSLAAASRTLGGLGGQLRDCLADLTRNRGQRQPTNEDA